MEKRLHWLDATRGSLLLLGVLLHSAQLVSPTHSWMVNHPNSLWGSDHLVNGIHLFRMEALFLISGLVARDCFLMQKTGDFVRCRLARLLVPLFTVGLLVNIPTLLFLGGYPQAGSNSLGDLFLMETWLLHLWFLLDLLFFSLLIVALEYFRFFLTRRLPWRIPTALPGGLWLRLFSGVVLALGTAILFKGLDQSPWWRIEIPVVRLVQRGLFDYFPVFVFGYCLGTKWLITAMKQVKSNRVAASGFQLTTLLVIVAVLLMPRMEIHALTKAFSLLSMLVAKLAVCVVAILALCRLHESSKGYSAWIRRYSYSQYLLHHSTILVAGSLCIASGVGPLLTFATAVILGVGFPWLVKVAIESRAPHLLTLLEGSDRIRVHASDRSSVEVGRPSS